MHVYAIYAYQGKRVGYIRVRICDIHETIISVFSICYVSREPGSDPDTAGGPSSATSIDQWVQTHSIWPNDEYHTNALYIS